MRQRVGYSERWGCLQSFEYLAGVLQNRCALDP